MSAAEVIGSYHDLWHIEQSFRMSKTDLRATPIFHRTRDAIEAHLTVVFTALAISRFMQDATGGVVEEDHHIVAAIAGVHWPSGWAGHHLRPRDHWGGEGNRG